MELLVGNLCSLLAMVTDSVSATRKTAKEVLWVQNLSQLIYLIGTLVLKGYSGAVQNGVSILRNLAAIRGVNSRALEWGFAGLGVVLGVACNNLGFMGLLPVIANFQYTLAVFRFRENERALKRSLFVAVLLFAGFNAAIWNVVGVITNLVVAGTTAAALLRKQGN